MSVCPRPPSLAYRIITGVGLCLSSPRSPEAPRAQYAHPRAVVTHHKHASVPMSSCRLRIHVLGTGQPNGPRAGTACPSLPPSLPSPLPRRHPEGQHVALLERAAPRQGRLQHAPHHAPLLRARRPGQAAAPPSLTAPSLTPSLSLFLGMPSGEERIVQPGSKPSGKDGPVVFTTEGRNPKGEG